MGQGLTALSFAWVLAQFENIGVHITNGIVQATEFIADKVVARKVVTEYFEMKDSATGDFWCVSIANGEIVKFKGTCGDFSDKEVEPPAGGSTSGDESAPYVEPVSGCTDQAAINFNPGASEDDGSCAYQSPEPVAEPEPSTEDSPPLVEPPPVADEPPPVTEPVPELTATSTP